MLQAIDIMTGDVIGIRDSGIVTERDTVYRVTALEKQPETVLVRDIMRYPCITVRPDLSLTEVAQLFAETGIQRAPVVQDQELMGIISMTDILMKSDVGGAQPADILSQRILDVLQHTRILSDEQEQIAQECAVAWDVVEALEANIGHYPSTGGK